MHPPAPSPSPCNWAGLNESLLEIIFSFLCSSSVRSFRAEPDGDAPVQTYHHSAPLPTVCRHWRDVYERSDRLWRCISLDLALAKHSTCQDTLYDAILRWLCKRGPVVERLDLRGCHMVQCSLLETYLKRFLACATSLCSLHLSDLESDADCLLSVLCSSASGLKHLGMKWYQPRQGVAAPLCARSDSFERLSSLKRLASLSLKFDYISGLNPDQVGFIASLPALTYLELSGRKESLVITPQVFLQSKYSCLRELCLSNCRISQFNPLILEALSRLSYLCLDDVLAAKPLRQSGTRLWDSLSELKALRRLRIVQPPADVNVLQIAFSCTSLKALTVLCCHNVGPWPPTTSCYSAQTAQDPGLRCLESLHLEEVGIQRLPASTFWSTLPALTSLCWRAVRTAPPPHSRLRGRAGLSVVLPQEAIDRLLPQLRSFRLEYSGASDWRATTLPMLLALSRARNLTFLSLQGNFLGEDADFWVSMMKDLALEKLNLENCNLIHVPREVYKLTHLEELSLMNNPKLIVTPEDKRMLSLIPKVWMDE